jgi:hypothetical protein
MYKPPRLNIRVRHSLAASVFACTIAAATISAQYGVFEPGFEAEIWELMTPSLQIPRQGDDWASGVAWINQELFVVDNLTGKTTKFDANLQLVDTAGADWHGDPGTPTEGWQPNEAVPAAATIDGVATTLLVVSDCTYNGSADSTRVVAFSPDGAHRFTIVFPPAPGFTPYQPCLNGVAVQPSASFHLTTTGAVPSLTLSGDFAVAWPERLTLNAGAALVYRDTTFTYDSSAQHFDAPQPQWQLTADVTETGDASVHPVMALTGVSFDRAGNFYMVDSWTGRLHGYQRTATGFVHRFAFGTPVDPDDPESTSFELAEAYGMTLWPSDSGDRLLITLPETNRAVVYAPQFAGGDLVAIQYLFKLDGLGAVSGLPHSSAFDAQSGRVAVSDSAHNSIKIFRSPELAVFNLHFVDTAGQPVTSVCAAEDFQVRFSITVPELKSPVQLLSPILLVDGAAVSTVPTPGGPYGVADVGTADDPVRPRVVLTYTYPVAGPAAPGVMNITASASAMSVAVDGGGQSAAISDVFEKSAAFTVANCAGNQPPSVSPALASTTSTFGAPNATGWRKVEPVSPATMLFHVTLTAADADGGVQRIRYQLLGVNSTQLIEVAVPPLADGSYPASAAIEVPVVSTASLAGPTPATVPGATAIQFSALDDDFRWSATQTLDIKLDNTLPNICFTIPYETGIEKAPGERWWKAPVIVPVSASDSYTPVTFLTVPPQLQNGTHLLFASEGAGQFASLGVMDGVGHTRTLPSNTTLDVCGAGRTGANVNIDMTPPVVNGSHPAGQYPMDTDLVFTAVDPAASTPSRLDASFSGVRRLEYSFDGFATAPIVATGVTFTHRLQQAVTISSRAIDWAGNAGPTLTATYGIRPANVPPVCSAAQAAADLWPPNHKQVYVSITGVTDADGQPITIRFQSILQDEPTNSVGQGNTLQDGGIEQNATRAWVRAERSGTPKVPGDGRVYLIGFSATDPLGASCTGTVRLDVPHDQRGTPAVLSPGRWNALTGQRVTPP